MRLNSIVILNLAFVLLISADAFAQRMSTSYSSNYHYEVAQWQIIDIVFKIRLPSNVNPFDLEFGAALTGPSDSRLTVPGFYNGKNEWILRFSTPTVGEWNFRTFSTSSALAGHSGKLSVTPNTRPQQHGALKVMKTNPGRFVYEDGTSAFPLAFELDWLFALDYGNKSGLPKTETILQAVKKNGFNHIVANIYAYDVGWKIDTSVPDKYFYGRPSYSAFLGTNENPDFSALNVELFQHWDRLLDNMQTMGLDAHLMIYVWNKKVKWPDIYTQADNRYFDYVIKRFQAYPNVVWDVSKEALDYGRCDIPYLNERISRIRRLDAFDRLVTVHDYEYNSLEHARVDFVSIQSWRSDLYSLMLQASIMHADKPVVNIEHGGYEASPYQSFQGNYTNPETCLLRTYECVFAGVYGSYYWQGTAWNIVIHDALDLEAATRPRFDYYKHLATLFSNYDFNNLKPSVPKLTTNNRIAGNNLATNGYALSNGSDTHLMLIRPESERVDVILPKPATGMIRYHWFDPYTGEQTQVQERRWTGWEEFIKPWDHFAVLILDSK